MAKKPMTKLHIISHFAKKFELTRKITSGIIEEVAALALSETKKTGTFTLPGIGKLVLVRRKARMGRNPQTGKAIKIPAKTVVRMRVAKAAQRGDCSCEEEVKKQWLGSILFPLARVGSDQILDLEHPKLSIPGSHPAAVLNLHS
jgi:DNA-binding protein HU-beta